MLLRPIPDQKFGNSLVFIGHYEAGIQDPVP